MALACIFLSIAYILGAGRRAKIGLAIIKTILVNVIDKHIIRNFDYLTVHADTITFAPIPNRASRVECRAAPDNKPFVFGKPKIIIRIDDGVLALCKRYPAEGVAVAQAPV